MDRNYDCMLKLVLLGDYDVGKASLITQFVYEDKDEPTPRRTVCSIGVDFQVKTITVDGKRVKLQIWDTAGQERFRSMNLQYCRRANGIVLVYDITKERTFSNIRSWLDSISEYAPDDVQIALVGNRVHLETERQVSEERGRKLASNYDILFFEASSHTNVNVTEVFVALTTKILKYRSMKPPISDDVIKGRPMDHNYDCMLKLVMLGDSNVGKSNFISQFMCESQDSPRRNVCSIGADSVWKTITVGGKRVKLQIWDTPGHERLRLLTLPYCRGAKGVVLLYDITREESFSNIPRWLDSISEHAPDDVQIALVGNRVDLETKRQVSEERGRKLASNYDILFFEASSHTNVNVAEVFEALIAKILKYGSIIPSSSDDIIRLDRDKGNRSAAKVRINNDCC